MWKAKSATTHCECLCLARIIALPLGHWPATQVFPGRNERNSSWTAWVLLGPQNLNNLKRTCNSLLIPDPEQSPTVHITVIYSQWIWISYQLKVCNDHWEKHSYLARNYLYRIQNYRALLIIPRILSVCIYSVAKLHLLICVWQIQLWSGSEWLIDFINWKLRIWISRKG